MGNLYFGDNLDILRNHIKDQSVDVIYLDPPFNSKRDYNLLFKTPKGHHSDASITAFEDTWHWGSQAEQEFDEIFHQSNITVSEMMQALRKFLGENDIMAYLVMMCNRLLELHRVLKDTGSLYLHCDPTASHYLKIVLDAIFGKENFRNEITWKRQTAHSDASRKFPNVADIILFYAKSERAMFVPQYVPHSGEYVTRYKFDDKDGKGVYTLSDITAPEGGGMAAINKATGKPNGWYEWKGFPPPERGWRFKQETMQKLDEEGRIYYPSKLDGSFDFRKRLRLKRYLSEQEGTIVGTVWDDIFPVNSQATERIGYPTQKPVALLERIIKASCPAKGLVLDPFCGCGTAVHAAQTLGREWIGIDITTLAISTIENRLRKYFPEVRFHTHGIPRDLEGARNLAKLDKYEFQYWVCHLLGAQPYKNKKKGADGGIDGIIYFKDNGNHHKKIIVSVKGGEHVNVAMVRDLGHVVAREKAEIGLFVTLADPTRPMREEAAKAGFYAPPFLGMKYGKLQILTIEGFLKGTEFPEYPSATRGGFEVNRPKGQAAKQMSFLLPYDGGKQDEIEVEVTAPIVDGQDEVPEDFASELPEERAVRGGKRTSERYHSNSSGRSR